MASKRRAAHKSVRVYRAKMKQQGFRQISIWLPDTKSPKFRKECRRQSKLASAADRSAQLDDLLIVAAGSVEGWTKRGDIVTQIMVDKVLTLPREKIGKRVGHLSNTLMIRVGRALTVWLGMS